MKKTVAFFKIGWRAALRAPELNDIIGQLIFSPHWMQNLASVRFSAPQRPQALDFGFSPAGFPHRGQKRELGVRFFPQCPHWLNTNC